MLSNKIIVLCPQEAISLDLPDSHVPTGTDAIGLTAPYAEDTIEDIVVCLAAVEAAWSTGEFQRLQRTLCSIMDLADRAGLKDVSAIAQEAERLVHGQDEVALAAVIARLVRIGEASLATLLEISYRLI